MNKDVVWVNVKLFDMRGVTNYHVINVFKYILQRNGTNGNFGYYFKHNNYFACSEYSN